MFDLIASAGKDPYLVGIATIGGALSLAYLVFTLLRIAYRSRLKLYESLGQRRIRRARSIVSDYKLARKMKLMGHSDLLIANWRFRIAAIDFLGIIFYLVIAFFNFMAFVANIPAREINLLLAYAFLFLTMRKIIKTIRSVREAFSLVLYANEPDMHSMVKRELNALRRDWLP